MSHETSGIIEFIGHLHPLLVHLPIGFLVLLAVLEILACSPSRKHLASASRVILVLTVPVAIATVACGWVLSWSGGYDAQLLAWHKWLGTAVGIAVVILVVLHWRGWLKTYRVALAATVLLLAVASHFGGSLTHGSDYLTFILSRHDDPPSDRNPLAQPVFESLIQPVFKHYCVSCHGPEKSKGGLRMDTRENLLKGGDSGPEFKVGDLDGSRLIRRVTLPPDDDDHMPPDGKPQPTPDEIRLLEWWIETGAPMDKTVEELNLPEDIRHTLELRFPGKR